MKLTKLKKWYGKYERPLSSLSLIFGFIFDAVTLERIDKVWDNFWVLAHILLVAILMVLVHSVKSKPGDETNPQKLQFWLVNILQFVFGGLLSVFLVFYFRSADLSSSWPFLLILAIAFWANESLKRHFVRLTFQVSIFFLSLFCCAIFLVPVLMHEFGTRTFIISGLLSLGSLFLFLYIVSKVSNEKFKTSRSMIFLSVLGIYVGMNVLYFTNLIPPIPLSIKDSGVYHFIEKNSIGQYVGQFEYKSWEDYFKIYHEYHFVQGETAYAYSAVFSPTSLNTTIVHKWQYYDKVSKHWIQYDSVLLPVFGGRNGGFRTFSTERNLTPGKWRVNVETLRGQGIGRIRFNVITSPADNLKTKILE
ncbi:DUF2914 domain-containing protein [Patescibacteria group bacterium]|nr:DUF2914 domain-containing protein [Patescibacteria group bacterium]